jgi:hypothetical protein
VAAIWDHNPYVLILVSLAMIFSWRIRKLYCCHPRFVFGCKISVTWLVLIGIGHRCPTASYHPPIFLMNRQSPQLLYTSPIIPFSRFAVTCLDHLNKVGSLDHASFFPPHSYMAYSSSNKSRSEQAREEGMITRNTSLTLWPMAALTYLTGIRMAQSPIVCPGLLRPQLNAAKEQL